MKCPQCQSEMKNLGNVKGIIYTSIPAQWDDTYVCDNCKVKINKRERGVMPTDYSYLSDYKSLNNY